jgi:hypothetical protein
MAQRTPAAERFWIKVAKNGPTPAHAPDLGPCWVWTAGMSPKGYGWFKAPDRARLAHQFAYMLTVGPIPEGTELDHLCRNRACVNPGHLEPVDHATNVRRGDGGPGKFPRTHCPQGHEYTESNTRWAPSGGRRCRKCNAAHQIRWRRKQEARAESR